MGFGAERVFFQQKRGVWSGVVFPKWSGTGPGAKFLPVKGSSRRRTDTCAYVQLLLFKE